MCLVPIDPVDHTKALSNLTTDDQLFDILEDEQEDAISRSRLQTERESYQANDARTGGEATNQIYLLPIKPKYENKFLFNITLNARLSKEGIDRPKSVLLTLRKRSPNQPDERCKIVVHKQTDAKVNELERVNRTNSGGLREMGALEAADYESSTSNLVKYRLDRLLSSAFEDWPDAWSTGAFAREERLLLFTATNCDFESAMVNIKYESIQVGSKNISVYRIESRCSLFTLFLNRPISLSVSFGVRRMRAPEGIR